jgi:hypothetical protein
MCTLTTTPDAGVPHGWSLPMTQSASLGQFFGSPRCRGSGMGIGVWLNPLQLGELVERRYWVPIFHLTQDVQPRVELFFWRLPSDARERAPSGQVRGEEPLTV